MRVQEKTVTISAYSRFRARILFAKGQEVNHLSVLIPDGEDDLSFKVLTCLAQIPNIEIHVLSSKKDPRARFSRFCRSFHFRDNVDAEQWFDHIENIVRSIGISVVLPVFEEGTRFVCAWRERIARIASLPVLPKLATFDLAIDKGSLSELLVRHELPHPRTAGLRQALQQGVDDFPVLIKPRRSNDGVGIRFCENIAAIEQFAASCGDALDDHIVQEYVEGRDLSCSVLCCNGKVLAYTIHQPIAAHSRPFAASLCIRHIHSTDILETTKKLMSVLGWSGVANIDFRYNERSERREILEINPRFSGNVVGSLTAGVNFPYLACLTALTEELPPFRYRLQNYMEIRDAIKMLGRKLKGKGGLVPNLARETNLPFIFRDPIPFFNRSIKRHDPGDDGRYGQALSCTGFVLPLLLAMEGGA